jgi:hypothetical protein
MIIKNIHRITALTLAILMFCASVGFSVDLHYCKGDLKSFSFFGEASSCHTSKKSCPHHQNLQAEDGAEKKDCCNNETVEFDDLDEDFTFSPVIEFSELNIKFVTAFIYSFIGVTFPITNSNTFLKSSHHKPPIDIYVLLERYLL